MGVIGGVFLTPSITLGRCVDTAGTFTDNLILAMTLRRIYFSTCVLKALGVSFKTYGEFSSDEWGVQYVTVCQRMVTLLEART